MKFTDVIEETIRANNVSSVFGLQGGAVRVLVKKF